jgi:hypothetical protein
MIHSSSDHFPGFLAHASQAAVPASWRQSVNRVSALEVEVEPTLRTSRPASSARPPTPRTSRSTLAPPTRRWDRPGTVIVDTGSVTTNGCGWQIAATVVKYGAGGSKVSCQVPDRAVSAWMLSIARLMLFFDGRFAVHTRRRSVARSRRWSCRKT